MADAYTPPVSQALVYLCPDRLNDLKRQLVLFDRVVTVKSVPPLLSFSRDMPEQLRMEMEFLQQQGLLIHFAGHPDRMHGAYHEMLASELHYGHPSARPGTALNDTDYDYFADYWLESTVSCFRKERLAGVESVPILRGAPGLQERDRDGRMTQSLTDIMRISLSAFPMPADDTPWETIISFRQELAHRKWGLRRFFGELSRKRLSANEVRDELEWNVEEYSRALQYAKVKASYSSFETFVITPLEIIEHVAKFNWSAIAKGIVAVKKRRAELLSAEISAPGKECAFVFEARQRFSK